MSGEWKPGDVAMVPFPGREVRCFRTEQGWLRADLNDGGHPVRKFMDPRPLVVIDPEDAGQVERLLAAYLTDYDGQESVPRPDEVASMRTALREFARPTPRIEEPLERWSRVFDGEGREWCRTEWDGGLDKPWQHDGIHAHWSALSKHHGPVTLSPGVPS